jgi:hypothetical protein
MGTSASGTPLGRIGQPDDVSTVVAEMKLGAFLSLEPR